MKETAKTSTHSVRSVMTTAPWRAYAITLNLNLALHAVLVHALPLPFPKQTITVQIILFSLGGVNEGVQGQRTSEFVLPFPNARSPRLFRTSGDMKPTADQLQVASGLPKPQERTTPLADGP